MVVSEDLMFTGRTDSNIGVRFSYFAGTFQKMLGETSTKAYGKENKDSIAG